MRTICTIPRLGLLLLVLFLALAPAPRVAAAPAADPPRYAAYLKDPAALGFAPDPALLEAIHEQVRARHYSHVPDDKLFAGVAHETERLAREAGLEPHLLAGLPHDASYPERAAHRLAGKLDRGVLYYAMICGLLEGTNDPYTVMMTPSEYRRIQEDLRSRTFGGIGIYISLDRDHGNRLAVVEPIEGTPAAVAGLATGDFIVRIDGKSTAGMSLEDATTHIRGPVGQAVTLAIEREGRPGARDIPITRATIQAPLVSARMLDRGVGLIRLRAFGERTTAELDEAMTHLQAQGAKAFVLDLRNNPGGYLDAAVAVCSRFVASGTLVTYTTNRDGERVDYRARLQAHSALPVVLLVNGYSASASEITAGCLMDQGRAVVMGAKTYGKGSVQELKELPGGAALKLTVARFFTPKGRVIQGQGVTPERVVALDPRLVGRGDRDVQLKEAVEYLRGH